MAQKNIIISSTPEFERKVLKFITSQKLKGKKIDRSKLDRQAIEFYIENKKSKRITEER